MEYFSCDGTFEKCPKEFGQIYALHAIHHNLPERMESTLIAFALIKGKSEADYRKFFEILQNKVIEEFGNLGGAKCFIMDHELAAIGACKQIYNRQNDRVRSCYFHFTQNIVKNIGNCCLKPYWNEPSLIKFVRELQGAVFLPPELCSSVWTATLEQAPFTEEDEHFNQAIQRFKQYFGFWQQVEFTE